MPPTVILLAIHVLVAVIWVGGMFFAYIFLRPAALTLETEQRVDLWFETLSRFFPWIWGIAVIAPLSGYALLFALFDNLEQTARYVWIMQWCGWTMITLFAITFVAFYREMAHRVKKRLIPEAGLYLNRIRIMISINLALGIGTVITAATGRFW